LEKRRFPRVPCTQDVLAVIVDTAGTPLSLPHLHMKSRNISRTGICLETEALAIDGLRLLTGTPGEREHRLRMTFAVAPGEAALTATGEVRWYDVVRREGKSFYQLGVEFIEIQEEGRDRLLRFLKTHEPKGFIERLFG
jgi:hypothetical protein